MNKSNTKKHICTECGKEYEYAKEMNKEGHCYNCSTKIVTKCAGVMGEFETNLSRHYSNKWLARLQSGRTVAKYAAYKPYVIPKSFYKHWNES